MQIRVKGMIFDVKKLSGTSFKVHRISPMTKQSHIVTYLGRTAIMCDCLGYRFRHDCNHCRAVYEYARLKKFKI